MLVKDLSTKIHVGIDVSKLTLDAFILERKLHRKFKNNSKGFTSLFQWVKNSLVPPLTPSCSVLNIPVCIPCSWPFSLRRTACFIP